MGCVVGPTESEDEDRDEGQGQDEDKMNDNTTCTIARDVLSFHCSHLRVKVGGEKRSIAYAWNQEAS